MGIGGSFGPVIALLWSAAESPHQKSSWGHRRPARPRYVRSLRYRPPGRSDWRETRRVSAAKLILRAGQRSSAYAPWLDDREAARALIGDFRDLLDRVAIARGARQSVERQDDDAGSSLTMPNCHLAKSPVVGNDDTSGRLRQCENTLVAIASADVLGIDDVEATLDQPFDDCPGDAFIREEGRHAWFTRLRRFLRGLDSRPHRPAPRGYPRR